MKLKNVLIVVNNIEKSKEFYRNLFGLDVVTDFGGNVILTEGLVLQDEEMWNRQECHGLGVCRIGGEPPHPFYQCREEFLR